VGYVSTAIEIADSRIRNWKITLAGTIADNASAGAYVVGAGRHVLADVDLESCAMVLTSNNEVVSTGTGAACLGHPLNALDWLARKMIEHERPLEAGDVVLSGALGPMTAVAAGDVLRAEITGLGAVSVRFR
jgi:2-keto-4-pentenoate hydratase